MYVDNLNNIISNTIVVIKLIKPVINEYLKNILLNAFLSIGKYFKILKLFLCFNV